MKRKPPVKHKVKQHTREGRSVQSYERGKGTKLRQKRNSKVVGSRIEGVPLWLQTVKGLGSKLKEHAISVVGKTSWGAFGRDSLRIGDEIILTDKSTGAQEKKLRVKDHVKAAELSPGQTYALGYTQINKGYDLFQFGGISDPRNEYGDKDIKKGWGKYSTIRELKKSEGVKSMKQIEDLDERYGGYGYNPYIVIRSYEGYNYGLYPHRGRWCAGSGAMPVTFFRVEEVT